MNLFEINELLYKLIESPDGWVDEESGIILNAEAIESLKLARDEKREGLLLYSEKCDSDAELVDERIKALEIKKKTILSKGARAKEYVLNDLTMAGEKKFEGKIISTTVCAGRESIKYDESRLPAEFFTTKTTQIIDKDKIKEQLANGKAISGVEVKKTPYLIIR